MPRTTHRTLAALGLIGSLALAGCSSSNPLEEESGSAPAAESGAIVVGSQDYYSNEVIAEIYAQALEAADFEVERNFTIGQRDAYLPSVESGEINLFPEYSGNLLQHYEPDTEARSPEDVYAALGEALPESLAVLEQSTASDQDSYTVTAAFAEENNLTSIADLSTVDGELTLGGPPELAERPYGPQGLADTYGIEVGFEATGPTTVEDLLAGTINVANVYTADPRISTEDLMVLEDPESLFLASNVVPLVSADVAEEIADVIDPVSAALTPEDLVELNVQSSVEQRSSEEIATEWLTEQGLN
ncbi:ABC transporter substrate-binding protein [Zhihengliuella flava]|uniref:Osmoprotectant transport system substrate-binding protein n=1 Tax=Zhihengliuella flava TaxID=1285193 RepID=A0A931D9G1_9MICC|nr:ABC transporter substrate-binding protein [Zhihengliuella flava]MBG6084463.1 osmoprotectant transport system substrate-binding protein [Zhihengliuella flava]